MIDLVSVRRQLDFERRTLAEEGYVLEQMAHVSRLRRSDGARCSITFSRLPEASADDIIMQQAARYRDLGVEVEWKVYQHDEPPDLLARVERFGFLPGPRETVMVLDLRDKPGWMDRRSSYDVRRVESDDQVRLYRAASEAIFENDHGETAGELLACIRSGSKQQRGYVVADGNIAVSVGRLYTHPESSFGGLYGGGTLNRYRNRGLYQAVVAARAADASESGARYLLVDALPASQSILEKLGFVHLCYTWPCSLTP
jgi:hypothetical protein